MTPKQTNAAARDQGAPSSLILTTMIGVPLLCAVMIYGLVTKENVAPMAFALAAFAMQGVCFCFYWRRLSQSFLKTFISIWSIATQWLFMFGIFLSLVATIFMDGGVNPYISAFGFFSVCMSSLAFSFAWINEQKGAAQMKAAGFSFLGGALTISLVCLTVLKLLPQFSSFSARAGLERIYADEHDRDNSEHMSDHEGLVDIPPDAEHHEMQFADAAVHSEHAAPHAAPAASEHTAHKQPTSSHSKPTAAPQGAHWSYEGISGPMFWGKIDEKFALCESGREQSPIDLNKSWRTIMGRIETVYKPSVLRIVDNGHTIQVNQDAGSRAKIGDKFYNLKQFHFHAASEHLVSGISYPMELHFVHQDEAGKLAVLGVFVERGQANPEMEKVIRNLPTETGSEKVVNNMMINFNGLLPKVNQVFHYSGSLTTPPCSEGVNWNVFTTPIQLSDGQIEALRAHYAHNNRPTQKIFDRMSELGGSADKHAGH